MAEEARFYSYKVDRVTGEILPVIVDKWNHCWDAVRYALDGYIKKDGDAHQSDMY
jgi:phage terminase large subunit